MKADQPKSPKFYTIEQIAECLDCIDAHRSALDRKKAPRRAPDQRPGSDFRGGLLGLSGRPQGRLTLVLSCPLKS